MSPPLPPTRSPDQRELDAIVGLLQRGAWHDALQYAGRLVERCAPCAPVFTFAGVALAQLGRHEDAEAAYAQAAQLAPGDADAHFNLGTARHQQGQLLDAERAYRAALALNGAHVHALNNLAVILKTRGAHSEAVPLLRAALAAQPAHADAMVNLGDALLATSQYGEAADVLEQALAVRSDLAIAWRLLAVALVALGRTADAIAAYQRLIGLDPDNADAALELGNLLSDAGRIEESVEMFARASALRPHCAGTVTNLASALEMMGRLDEAMTCYDRALALDPEYERAQALRLQLQLQMGDWRAFDAFEACADRLGLGDVPVAPFALLSLDPRPERQRARAEAFARMTFAQDLHSPVFARPSSRPQRLRIGYFSSDFHDHATMYLLAGVLRCHDRERFEVHAYSYGAIDSGSARAQMNRDVEHVHKIRALDDAASAALARSHGLDVAIDLKGYTFENRIGIFAYRPAPVQVSWLGYPGTLGAPFIDYIVADPVVLPEGERSHYSENVIRLPHSYQPNDDQRVIASVTGTRADHGLPPEGFVFCSFNATGKIGPTEFAVWMEILREVPGAVLWLFASNRWAEAALKSAATEHGINPARLVFAARLPHAEHLARHAHADLFLDSFTYNAHTTASDALWAGVPVLTMPGRSFAARVAASLVHAAGLPEMAVATVAQYKAKARELALDPEAYAQLRARTKGARNQALFDTAAFTRNLEMAFSMAHDRWRSDCGLADISVPPQ